MALDVVVLRLEVVVLELEPIGPVLAAVLVLGPELVYGYLLTYVLYLFIHGKIFSIYYNKKFHYNYNVHCFTRLPCGSPTGTYYIVGQFSF